MELKPILSFNEQTPMGEYEKLFSSPIGTVFRIYEGDFETVTRRINDLLQEKSSTVNFRYAPIVHGLPLYTMYGPEHCIVTMNS